MKNKMVIYGCGGTGINVVSPYITTPLEEKPGYAKVEAFLIDTSESNINTTKVRNAFYKIKLEKDAEGSGSIRAENAPEIMQQVPNFISEKHPGDINIVVASANGGSGSTIAPVLASELIKRGKPVISILFLDDNNLKSIENAYRTLVSYDSMAKKSGVPFITLLIPNVSIKEANEVAEEYISMLAMLFSNENHGLDNADLRNFLNFTKVTGAAPGVASLMITDKLGEKYNRNPLSLAMLHTSLDAQEASRGKFVTGYSCDGIFRLNDGQKIENRTVFFTTEYDEVLEMIRHLKDRTESFQAELSGVVNSRIKLDVDGGSVEENGLVL